MTNLQSTTLRSLNKVISASQQGLVSQEIPSSTSADRRAQVLSLDVVSVKNNHVLLQESASGRQMRIEKDVLQGLHKGLSKGDSLVLLSVNNKSASFVIEQAAAQSANKLSQPTLKNVAAQLQTLWTSLPTSVLKQVSPRILNHLSIAGNTQQSASLAAAILTIAGNNPQLSLKVDTSADVRFLKTSLLSPQLVLGTQALNAASINKALANIFSLAVSTDSSSNLLINLPLNDRALNDKFNQALSANLIKELKTLFSNGQRVNIQFDLNKPQSLISEISSQNTPKSPLSSRALQEINRALGTQLSGIKQQISTLLLSPHSANLQNAVVLESSKQNLQLLGAALKQNLTAGVSQVDLQNAAVLIEQNSQNGNKIQVNLLEKPLSVNIENAQLASVRLRSGTANSGDKALKDGKSVSDLLGLIQGRTSKVSDILKGAGINNVTKADNPNYLSNASTSSQLLKTQVIALIAAKGYDAFASSSKIDVLQANIHRDIHQLLPKAHSVTDTLPSILKQLQVIGKSATGDLRQFITQIGHQVIAHLPSNRLSSESAELLDSIDESIVIQNASSIKEMFGASITPNVTGSGLLALNRNQSQSGLVNALVNMLQASLQAKLMAQQPHLLPALFQSSQIGKFFPTASSGPKSANEHGKLLKDLGRLDPKGNLIEELNKVLSGHSFYKMRSAEMSLQHQDSFYYVLPNMFSSQHKDIEITIKREHEPAANEQTQAQQTWQLNMKLDIGDSGDVLAKVKLSNNNVDLNLYASSHQLKDKIMIYLPLLNRRLSALGLHVSPKCFIGKIPTTLHKTDYQLVQTYV